MQKQRRKSKLPPGNKQHLFNKGLTRFMWSLFRVLQNRATGRKALLAGPYTLGDCHQTLASSLIKLMVSSVGAEAQIK